MASLAAHLTASLILFPVGLRRLTSSTSLYLRSPSRYASKIWYSSQPNWKNLDLYALLISLPIGSFSNAFIFLSLSDNPTYRFSLLYQSLLLFFFWALLILIFLKQNCDLYIISDNFLFLFAGIAFAIEYYVTGRGVVGIGAEAYANLKGLAALCAICCVYLSLRPSAFFAEFMLSCGIVLKGSWVLQVGLSLYTDAFGLRGCGRISEKVIAAGKVDVQCQLNENMWRGMALMNFLFSLHVTCVVFVGFVVLGILNRFRGRWGCSSVAEVGVGSEGVLMRSHPEIEMQ